MIDVSAQVAHSDSAVSSAWNRVFAIAAAFICIVVIAARLTGPSDLHDQSQERTSAYTTDIALHGGDWRRWVLPMQQAMHPATKPPLYNWLAAPGVWLSEGRLEWPHRLPSAAAFAGTCLLLWWAGRRIDPAGMTGSLAAVIFASNYFSYKLAGLIRPDTILSLWLALGWVGVTIILSGSASAGQRRWWRVLIWSACALAVLTKGPPALLIPLFAAVLPWFAPGGGFALGRSWRALRVCGVLWGLPLVLAITALWLLLVWRIDPDHLYNTLIREEFVDRALGTGAEGVKEGPWDLVRTALNMPIYFVWKFLPWSVFFFGALYDLWVSRRSAAAKRAEPPAVSEAGSWDARFWMISGVTYTALVVVVFSLAAGKRGDYIASACISASLVIAWCMGHLGWALARRAPGLVLALALTTLGGLLMNDRLNSYALRYPLSISLSSFAREVRPLLEADPLPLEFYRMGTAPLQTMLHRSQPVATDLADLTERVESHGTLWLIVSDRMAEEMLAEAQHRQWDVQLRAKSEAARGLVASPPLEVRLYRVTARPEENPN